MALKRNIDNGSIFTTRRQIFGPYKKELRVFIYRFRCFLLLVFSLLFLQAMIVFLFFYLVENLEERIAQFTLMTRCTTVMTMSYAAVIIAVSAAAQTYFRRHWALDFFSNVRHFISVDLPSFFYSHFRLHFIKFIISHLNFFCFWFFAFAYAEHKPQHQYSTFGIRHAMNFHQEKINMPPLASNHFVAISHRRVFFLLLRFSNGIQASVLFMKLRKENEQVREIE